jgi:hypothetical protein
MVDRPQLADQTRIAKALRATVTLSAVSAAYTATRHGGTAPLAYHILSERLRAMTASGLDKFTVVIGEAVIRIDRLIQDRYHRNVEAVLDAAIDAALVRGTPTVPHTRLLTGPAPLAATLTIATTMLQEAVAPVDIDNSTARMIEIMDLNTTAATFEQDNNAGIDAQALLRGYQERTDADMAATLTDPLTAALRADAINEFTSVLVRHADHAVTACSTGSMASIGAGLNVVRVRNTSTADRQPWLDTITVRVPLVDASMFGQDGALTLPDTGSFPAWTLLQHRGGLLYMPLLVPITGTPATARAIRYAAFLQLNVLKAVVQTVEARTRLDARPPDPIEWHHRLRSPAAASRSDAAELTRIEMIVESAAAAILQHWGATVRSVIRPRGSSPASVALAFQVATYYGDVISQLGTAVDNALTVMASMTVPSRVQFISLPISGLRGETGRPLSRSETVYALVVSISTEHLPSVPLPPTIAPGAAAPAAPAPSPDPIRRTVLTARQYRTAATPDALLEATGHGRGLFPTLPAAEYLDVAEYQVGPFRTPEFRLGLVGIHPTVEEIRNLVMWQHAQSVLRAPGSYNRGTSVDPAMMALLAAVDGDGWLQEAPDIPLPRERRHTPGDRSPPPGGPPSPGGPPPPGGPPGRYDQPPGGGRPAGGAPSTAPSSSDSEPPPFTGSPQTGSVLTARALAGLARNPEPLGQLFRSVATTPLGATVEQASRAYEAAVSEAESYIASVRAESVATSTPSSRPGAVAAGADVPLRQAAALAISPALTAPELLQAHKTQLQTLQNVIDETRRRISPTTQPTTTRPASPSVAIGFMDRLRSAYNALTTARSSSAQPTPPASRRGMPTVETTPPVSRQVAIAPASVAVSEAPFTGAGIAATLSPTPPVRRLMTEPSVATPATGAVVSPASSAAASEPTVLAPPRRSSRGNIGVPPDRFIPGERQSVATTRAGPYEDDASFTAAIALVAESSISPPQRALVNLVAGDYRLFMAKRRALDVDVANMDAMGTLVEKQRTALRVEQASIAAFLNVVMSRLARALKTVRPTDTALLNAFGTVQDIVGSFAAAHPVPTSLSDPAVLRSPASAVDAVLNERIGLALGRAVAADAVSTALVAHYAREPAASLSVIMTIASSREGRAHLAADKRLQTAIRNDTTRRAARAELGPTASRRYRDTARLHDRPAALVELYSAAQGELVIRAATRHAAATVRDQQWRVIAAAHAVPFRVIDDTLITDANAAQTAAVGRGLDATLPATDPTWNSPALTAFTTSPLMTALRQSLALLRRGRETLLIPATLGRLYLGTGIARLHDRAGDAFPVVQIGALPRDTSITTVGTQLFGERTYPALLPAPEATVIGSTRAGPVMDIVTPGASLPFSKHAVASRAVTDTVLVSATVTEPAVLLVFGSGHGIDIVYAPSPLNSDLQAILSAGDDATTATELSDVAATAVVADSPLSRGPVTELRRYRPPTTSRIYVTATAREPDVAVYGIAYNAFADRLIRAYSTRQEQLSLVFRITGAHGPIDTVHRLAVAPQLKRRTARPAAVAKGLITYEVRVPDFDLPPAAGPDEPPPPTEQTPLPVVGYRYAVPPSPNYPTVTVRGFVVFPDARATALQEHVATRAGQLVGLAWTYAGTVTEQRRATIAAFLFAIRTAPENWPAEPPPAEPSAVWTTLRALGDQAIAIKRSVHGAVPLVTDTTRQGAVTILAGAAVIGNGLWYVITQLAAARGPVLFTVPPATERGLLPEADDPLDTALPEADTGTMYERTSELPSESASVEIDGEERPESDRDGHIATTPAASWWYGKHTEPAPSDEEYPPEWPADVTHREPEPEPVQPPKAAPEPEGDGHIAATPTASFASWLFRSDPEPQPSGAVAEPVETDGVPVEEPSVPQPAMPSEPAPEEATANVPERHSPPPPVPVIEDDPSDEDDDAANIHERPDSFPVIDL